MLKDQLEKVKNAKNAEDMVKAAKAVFASECIDDEEAELIAKLALLCFLIKEHSGPLRCMKFLLSMVHATFSQIKQEKKEE